ncbi:MAG TPA: molybdate ABC transporter substrate-binding protein [Steroidobacteraceae bacterium]|jgi:molybdate transport system substrate-binding protein|nr:molybdate ABC transporter substrate-binding protein [Steroidobacteraceae bacterium]
MRKPLAVFSCAVALFAAAALPAAAAELHVAVAANFSGPLQTLAPLFEKSSGNQLVISSGSSGQLYTQIRQGAPFDLFLSADTDKPKQLENEGLTVPGSRFIYAIGTLVLWSPRPGVVDDQGKVLEAQRYRYIGIANPQTAPYGTAAQQVLSRLNLWDKLNRDKKVVTGENITQTWQFASTGSVDMSFVALSQVLGADGQIAGSSWRVPQSLYDPIEQGAVAVAHGNQQAAAQAFLTWLRTDPSALAVIRAAGYRTAD